MTVQEYRDYIAAGNPVENGSEPHLFMHQMSQEAIRITMEINNNPSLMPLKISTVFLGFMNLTICISISEFSFAGCHY